MLVDLLEILRLSPMIVRYVAATVAEGARDIKEAVDAPLDRFIQRIINDGSE